MALFFVGASWPGRCIVGMQYILEFFPSESRVRQTLILLIINAASILASPLIIKKLRDHDTFPYLAFNLLIGFCSLVHVILFMPDSPWSHWAKDEF